MPPKNSTVLALGAAIAIIYGPSEARAFNLSFSSSDFGKTPVFSNVTTFAFDVDSPDPFQSGLYADPTIADIQYSVSGSLDATPSGFPAFGFALNHRFPSSPPITGPEFYALNASAVSGQTLRFKISPTANLSDGLQISELMDLGGGVVFRFDGREQDTGRYHPMFIELMSNGTGRIQNADNKGGVNPQDGFPNEIDVARGEEYITDLSFNPTTLTIGIPEPGTSGLMLSAVFAVAFGRRRTK